MILDSLNHIETGTGAIGANGLLPLTPFEIANRISYGMTSSPPDSALWAAAMAGQLTTQSQINAHVDRLAQNIFFSISSRRSN